MPLTSWVALPRVLPPHSGAATHMETGFIKDSQQEMKSGDIDAIAGKTPS
jgi:hypothetical protein